MKGLGSVRMKDVHGGSRVLHHGALSEVMGRGGRSPAHIARDDLPFAGGDDA